MSDYVDFLREKRRQREIVELFIDYIKEGDNWEMVKLIETHKGTIAIEFKIEKGDLELIKKRK